MSVGKWGIFFSFCGGCVSGFDQIPLCHLRGFYSVLLLYFNVLSFSKALLVTFQKKKKFPLCEVETFREIIFSLFVAIIGLGSTPHPPTFLRSPFCFQSGNFVKMEFFVCLIIIVLDLSSTFLFSKRFFPPSVFRNKASSNKHHSSSDTPL